jgi:hypothetical protein
MNTKPVDVLAVMANPCGFRNGGRWGTGDVAQWARNRGHKITTARALTALRREERAGNVICLGPTSSDGRWHGHDITTNAELQWRLTDEYAATHGNEACRAALARIGGAK